MYFHINVTSLAHIQILNKYIKQNKLAERKIQNMRSIFVSAVRVFNIDIICSQHQLAQNGNMNDGCIYCFTFKKILRQLILRIEAPIPMEAVL